MDVIKFPQNGMKSRTKKKGRRRKADVFSQNHSIQIEDLDGFLYHELNHVALFLAPLYVSTAAHSLFLPAANLFCHRVVKEKQEDRF